MDHNEAIQQMVAERYLLGELTAEQRDAFEEHAFDCPECSLDLRAGAAFIDTAKVELPKLAAASAAPSMPELHSTDQEKIRLAILAATCLCDSCFCRIAGSRFLPESVDDSLAPHGGD